MKLLSDWGFTTTSWQGQRGEYWVVGQAILLVGLGLLPAWPVMAAPAAPLRAAVWAIAAGVAALGAVLLGKGLLDLGANLTPLPYPRSSGSLIQTGIYGVVRHPLYGGLTLWAIAWALYQFSLAHAVGGWLLFVFLNAKATREEVWLTEKFPEYAAYQHRVKKLLPWIY